MNYQLLGRSGLRVSDLCLGTMTFGEDWGWGAAKDEARKIHDTYREAAGNFIDTANISTNGSSEKLVGEFIAGHREEVVLATKYTNAAAGFSGGVGVLGSQHHLFPMTGDELADELFAGAVGGNVGRVDEVAGRLAVGVVDFACLVLGRAPAPVFAESHRAEAKVGNAQAAAAEKLVVH